MTRPQPAHGSSWPSSRHPITDEETEAERCRFSRGPPVAPEGGCGDQAWREPIQGSLSLLLWASPLLPVPFSCCTCWASPGLPCSPLLCLPAPSCLPGGSGVDVGCCCNVPRIRHRTQALGRPPRSAARGPRRMVSILISCLLCPFSFLLSLCPSSAGPPCPPVPSLPLSAFVRVLRLSPSLRSLFLTSVFSLSPPLLLFSLFSSPSSSHHLVGHILGSGESHSPQGPWFPSPQPRLHKPHLRPASGPPLARPAAVPHGHTLTFPGGSGSDPTQCPGLGPCILLPDAQGPPRNSHAPAPTCSGCRPGPWILVWVGLWPPTCAEPF